MKDIRLDSILLFALLLPFVMGYRLGPGDTPYWLFGLIFLGLLFYVCLDLFSISERNYHFLKLSVLWLLIVGFGSVFVSAIIVRHQTHPTFMIHDIVLQQESAIRFLLDGKNPYAVSYFDTPMEQWHYSGKEVNPALYHFVMEPFYLIFALPFYFLSNIIFSYFDGRIPLLFLFFTLLILAGILVKDVTKKLLFIILLAFNPSMLPYILEGRSDIFMFSFLFMGLFLLHKRQYLWAGIPIALAFATKQSAWPILPFYIAFLYFTSTASTSKESRSSPRHLQGAAKKTLKLLVPFIITFNVVVLPFFLWDQKAFLDSTIFYLSGSGSHSYPVSGYGLGTILHQIGIIKDVNAYYPFYIWQMIVGIPLLIILLRNLKSHPTIRRLILVYGIFLFVFWYLSRYLNNSHLGYLSMLLITSYFWPKEKVVKV